MKKRYAYRKKFTSKDGVFYDPIISSELTLFAQELHRFLSPIVQLEIAKQVGFVQRSSKYQADELIALCVAQPRSRNGIRLRPAQSTSTGHTRDP
jgi:hypothetical protein